MPRACSAVRPSGLSTIQVVRASYGPGGRLVELHRDWAVIDAPVTCLLPSQCRCGEDQVTVDQIGRLAIDDPPRSHRCPSPAELADDPRGYSPGSSIEGPRPRCGTHHSTSSLRARPCSHPSPDRTQRSRRSSRRKMTRLQRQLRKEGKSEAFCSTWGSGARKKRGQRQPARPEIYARHPARVTRGPRRVRIVAGPWHKTPGT